MIDKRNIQAACDDIVREFAPLQVILFGSYAYGTPTENSDVDLLVIVPTARSERHRIQQCIEKYLKAWLQEANIPIPRSHDLKELLALIVPTVPLWQVWEPDFSEISKHAVATRYPGDSATLDTAGHAMQICDQVRHAIRAQLKLPPDVTVGETQ